MSAFLMAAFHQGVDAEETAPVPVDPVEPGGEPADTGAQIAECQVREALQDVMTHEGHECQHHLEGVQHRFPAKDTVEPVGPDLVED